MIPQYVAASLVSENKVLAHPASVDSIPTSAGQEDHVSMGNASGLKAWQVLANAERVLAIELLAGAQGVEFLAPLQPGVGVRRRARARPLALAAAPRRPHAVGRHRGGRRVDPRRLARRGGRGRGRRALVSAGNGVNPKTAQVDAALPRQRARLRRARLARRDLRVRDRQQPAQVARRRPRCLPARHGLHVVAGAVARSGRRSASRERDPFARRHGRGALRRPLRDPRAPRHRAERALVVDGGAAADAAEQPRRGGRRAARGARRLRRHGQGGAEPRGAARARPVAADAGRRRDAARPERQAGRRLPDEPRGSARPDRELAARPALGDLGRVPPARGARPDDVRPDDGGQLDLHRQPGDPAGHLPDVRRGRRAALRLGRPGRAGRS